MEDKNLQTRLEIVIDQLIDDEHAVMAEQVRQAITEIEKLESSPKIDTEKIMKQWDAMRKRIAEGDKSDAPTVWFGSVIDSFTEQIAQRSER